MTSKRYNYSRPRYTYGQTAAPQGGGCLSGFLLPPLAVLLVSCFLIFATGGLTTSGESLLAVSAASADGVLSTVFTPEVRYWANQILSWSVEAGLDPNLAATVMQIESCGNPYARSSAGAMGLFQVMPFHFQAEDDPYDPVTNAARGLAYLSKSLEKAGGEYRLAFAGYNGGIGVIGRGEFSWAAETQRYAYWGGGIYADVLSGAAESQRLKEWLAAGGASLCRQAHQRLGLRP